LLSKDALVIVEEMIETVSINIMKQAETLMDNGKNRMFTQKTAESSFIALMTQQDVDPKISRDAVQFSQDTVLKLQDSSTTTKPQ